MKKSTIYILIGVQLLIILIFGSLFVSFFTRDSRSPNRLSDIEKKEGSTSMQGETQKEKEYSIEGIEEIQIQLASYDVSVYQTDEDKVRVVQKANKTLNENEKYAEEISSQTLRFYQRSTGLSFLFWGIKKTEIEVYIPKTYEKDIQIKTASGDVNLAGEMKLQDIEVSTASGEITSTKPIVASKATIKAISGDIEVKGMKAEEMKISGTSAGLELDQIEASRKYEIGSVSGKIQIEKIKGSGSIKTTSGGINIDHYEMTAAGEVKSTSGSIYLQMAEETNCKIEAKSTSGKITYPNGMNVVGIEPYHQLTLKTVSGKIEVTQE